jgi:hypothetical protein
MKLLEIASFISMLSALYCWRRGEFFGWQCVFLAEWFVQAWIPYPASFYSWHTFDVLNIAIMLRLMWICRHEWPLVSWLLLTQCSLKLWEYSRIVSDSQFQMDWAYQTHKMIDIAVGFTVTWLCISQQRRMAKVAPAPTG